MVALLALGLVGMHHLVVAACHHSAGGHSAHVSTVATTAAHEHVDHGAVPVAPLQGPQDAPESPGGLVGAAATCLAILLMIVGLVLPQVLARVRRWRSLQAAPLMPVLTGGFLKPPNLNALSVSRT